MNSSMKNCFWFVAGLFLTIDGLYSQELLHFEPVLSLNHVVEEGISYTLFGAVAPNDPNRLYLVRKTGEVSVLDVRTGEALPVPFLIVDDVSTRPQGGLYSMVFHPEYQSNGRLFVCYVAVNGDFVVEEYVRQSANRATKGKRVLVIQRPNDDAFHLDNGGWMGFGNDGYLHISVGRGLATNRQTNLASSLLRIDVNGDDFPNTKDRNYSIPSINPLADISGYEEVIANGFKNPWRCSFDSVGNLYIGALGGVLREEIDLIPVGYPYALNFGFPCFEGTFQHSDPLECLDRPAGIQFALPIFDYGHTDTLSGIIGGYVIETPIERLQGHYVYADLRDPYHLYSIVFDGTKDPRQFNGANVTKAATWRTSVPLLLQGVDQFVVSFFDDEENNLYLITTVGLIYKLDSIRRVGDFNGDGMVSLLDIDGFVQSLSGDVFGGLADGYQGLADINYDLVVDTNDILPFIELILD